MPQPETEREVPPIPPSEKIPRKEVDYPFIQESCKSYGYPVCEARALYLSSFFLKGERYHLSQHYTFLPFVYWIN